MSKLPKRKPVPRKRQYVNNRDLTDAIVAYQKECAKSEKKGLPMPSMPKYIGECIIQICSRLTRGYGFDFSAYSYRDEMVADAIELCVYAVRKYNNEKSSSGAFSYLTTVAINAMKKRIGDEKKQNYIKHKNFQTRFMLHEIDGLSPDDQSEKVVSDFEDKIARQKEALTLAKDSGKKKMR